MDRRERSASPQTMLQAALDGFQSGLWTSLVCEVESFNAQEVTCSAQPIIQVKVRQPDGTEVDTTLPLLIHVPVHFPRGGGATMTFPVKKGDECLVVFASRCIDSWWQLGAADGPDPGRPQAEFRMHDLSDGFAFVGFRSLTQPLSNISQTAVEIRTDDHSAYISLDVDSRLVDVQAADVIVEATGTINLKAPLITMEGAVIINGPTTLNGPVSQGATFGGGSSASSMIGPLVVATDVVSGGKSGATHTHHVNAAPGESDGPT